MKREMGEFLATFTVKDLQTAIAIGDLLKDNDLGLKDLKEFWIGYSKHLTNANRYDEFGRKIKRLRRTPEQKALRKKMLEHTEYGRVKP